MIQAQESFEIANDCIGSYFAAACIVDFAVVEYIAVQTVAHMVVEATLTISCLLPFDIGALDVGALDIEVVEKSEMVQPANVHQKMNFST